MDAAVPEALIANYEYSISSLILPDPDDRHVLAAAIHAHADVIVTFNLSDFPAAMLEPHGLSALHPDEFVLQLLEENPDGVYEAVARQRAALQNPPQTAAELLETFERQGLKQTAARLRESIDLL